MSRCLTCSNPDVKAAWQPHVLQIAIERLAGMLSLGQALKLVRSAQGKSLSDVAKKSGIGVAFLSLVESDARQPSLSSLSRIAEALGVPSELFIILTQPSASSLRTENARVCALADALRRVADAQAELKRQLERKKREAG